MIFQEVDWGESSPSRENRFMKRRKAEKRFRKKKTKSHFPEERGKGG